ncbi:TetR/AcrR family transcriptional regulator [Dethiobacter alkaliphilus]|nr:TetR/AcrR family transcriptional regulator [Dethiobacter alkaliphilus]MCW3491009.1 TetR/AcrR family transcriptional regulator [Dethiobacter alkaliphilus]
MKEKQIRILQAATEVFSQHPYHQVKIDDIASCAGVGKGTIYEYFSSKDELFFQMLQASSRAYHNEMAKAVQKGKTVKDKLQLLFDYQLDFIETHGSMARILGSEHWLPQDEFKALLRQQREQLNAFVSAILSEGIESGEFRPVSAEVVAQSVLGTLMSLWGNAFLEESPAPASNFTEELMDFFLHGLRSGHEI